MRTLYRDAALADGRSPELQVGVSVLVDDGHVAWIRPTDGEEDPGDAEVIDAGGATIVPGLVDCHSHLTCRAARTGSIAASTRLSGSSATQSTTRTCRRTPVCAGRATSAHRSSSIPSTAANAR